MLFLRWVVFALLAVSVVCFVIYLSSGDVRYRRLGVVIMKWTILAALGFFAVLIIERVFFFDRVPGLSV